MTKRFIEVDDDKLDAVRAHITDTARVASDRDRGNQHIFLGCRLKRDRGVPSDFPVHRRPFRERPATWGATA